MSAALPSKPKRAVIIGGGLAGMLAAAAVSASVDVVEIIEAHDLPDGPLPRKGVPQAAHFHTLLSSGAEALEQLIPGSTSRLVATGAIKVPVTTDMVMYSPEGWYRRWERASHFQITASRNLTDWVIRELVLADPKVRVRLRTKVMSLLGEKQRITGVRLRSTYGKESELPAHLVVDTSGRSTRTPIWLEELGLRGLKEDQVSSGLSYASRIYKAPVPTQGWPIINLQADFSRGHPRAGGIIPIEGDRWHVSLIGPPGDEPGRDAETFEQYARTLRHPIVGEMLTRATPLTGVSYTRTTGNQRYYFERLKPWPAGLVVVGDAVAAFNPVYGQGMSVAAIGALAIRRVLAKYGLTDDLGKRAQRAVAVPVNAAWTLSAGTDVHRPTSNGRGPNFIDRLLQRYISRLSRTATGSYRVATALTDVLMLQAQPLHLVTPQMLLAALWGPLRPQLGGPPLSPSEREVLESPAGDASVGE